MLSFFCIGAQKAGTSWLHQKLMCHPQVWFENRRKEFHYWDRFEKGTAGEGIDCYLNRFGGANVISGDITPSYATLASATIEVIASVQPHAKIIFILRDPVLRAWSAARMFMRNAWIERGDVSNDWLKELCVCPSFTARGNYAETINRWSTHFPAEAFLIVDYEQIRTSPKTVLLSVARHIGLNESSSWRKQNTVNEVVFEGQTWQLPSNVRQTLRNHYRALNINLEKELNNIGQSAAVDINRWQA